MNEDNGGIATVYIVKLITGEFILSEVAVSSSDEDASSVKLVNPILVDQGIEPGRFMFSEWISPFLDKPVIDIDLSDVVIFEKVNDQYVKLYGSFIAQIMINQVKMRVAESTGSDTQYYEILDAVEDIKKISKNMSEKFDIPEIDLSEFEEETKKFKPPLVH